MDRRREPRKLVDYLARYTHRVAISNHRILTCEDGQVGFTWRDRADSDRRKVAVIGAEEFIGRFLQHVLPDRFQRVRHYGLLFNRDKQARLAHCRELLGVSSYKGEEPLPNSAADWLREVLGIDIAACPCCGEPMRCQTLLPAEPLVRPIATRRKDQFVPWDTS